MQIILFGQLQDITGSHKMQLYGMELNKRYPLLANAKLYNRSRKGVCIKKYNAK